MLFIGKLVALYLIFTQVFELISTSEQTHQQTEQSGDYVESHIHFGSNIISCFPNVNLIFWFIYFSCSLYSIQNGYSSMLFFLLSCDLRRFSFCQQESAHKQIMWERQQPNKFTSFERNIFSVIVRAVTLSRLTPFVTPNNIRHIVDANNVTWTR